MKRTRTMWLTRDDYQGKGEVALWKTKPKAARTITKQSLFWDGPKHLVELCHEEFSKVMFPVAPGSIQKVKVTVEVVS